MRGMLWENGCVNSKLKYEKLYKQTSQNIQKREGGWMGIALPSIGT